MKETAECDRLNRRRDVLLQGRCRTSSWRVFNVELGDISEGGCCIVGSPRRFKAMEPVSLRFASFRNVDGTVRWIAGGKVGVEFRVPLKRQAMENLRVNYGIVFAGRPDQRR